MDCKNCQSTLSEADSFCNSCGAKVIRNRITIKQILQDFGEQFLNYDNRFLRTFKKLFTDPKDVIGGYLDGTRKKYVNVLSYFAIAITIAGLQIFVLTKYFPDFMNIDAISTEATADMNKRNMAFVTEYQSLMMMLNIPIYALVARLVFINRKKFNFAELTIMFMYILAQISIVTAVLTIPLTFAGVSFSVIGLAALPFQMIYSGYCLTKLYNLTTVQLIIKTSLFFLVLFVGLVIASLAMAGIMYLNGDFQNLIDAEQVKQAIG